MRTAVSITAISGFTEKEGDGRTNGMKGLYYSALRRAEHQAGLNLHSHYRTWNHDWRDHAATIEGYLGNADEKRVAIFGYSYGGGYGARVLAKELDKLGIVVDYMLLADPVYHHGWPFDFMRRVPSFQSVFRYPKIRLSRNVRCQGVEYWYQRNRIWNEPSTWPQGHHVYCANGKQAKNQQANGFSNRTHPSMDTYQPFVSRCREVAERLAQEVLRCDTRHC